MMRVTGMPLYDASEYVKNPITAAAATSFAMNQTSGSTSWPYFCRPARVRHCCTARATHRPRARTGTSTWALPGRPPRASSCCVALAEPAPPPT